MIPAPPASPGARLPRALLLCAFALAITLRLALWAHRSGPLWFEEDVPLAWAWKLWGFDGRGFDPNPHSAIWPHLSVYVFFAVQALQFMFGLARGAWSSTADWNAVVALDPSSLRAAAMLAAIAIGIAVLAAAGRLARRLAGAWGEAAVVLVLALDPLFVRHSLVVSPDMLLTLFVVLGLHASLDVIERGGLRDSLLAGLWLGLGTACKYSPLLLAVPIVLAHAHRPGGRRGMRTLVDGRLWLAATASLAAFSLATPFTVLDLLRRWNEFVLGAAMLGPGPSGNAPAHAGPEFFGRILPGDLGWPLCVLLALAAVWALVRRTPARVSLLAFLVAYLAAFSLVPTAFERYLMPAYPPALALGAAALAALASTRSLAHTAVVVLISAAALAGLLVRTDHFATLYLRPDTRALAREWFVANVPDSAVVAMEQAGPYLPDRIERARAAGRPGVPARRRTALARGPAYCTEFMPMSFPDPEISRSMYLLPDYLDFDYVVSSTGVSARYLAQPARFPVQVAFYEGLQRFATPVYRTPARAGTGPTITIYRLSGIPRPALEAWWAARVPHPPGFRNRRDAAHGAGLWCSRARFFTGAHRMPAALRAWTRALRWPGAPPSWRREFERAAVAAR